MADLPRGVAISPAGNATAKERRVSSKMNYRGLGWALRACDGARADELSKDYRALRT